MDTARARANAISAQVTGMSEHPLTQLTALLAELRTMGDPATAQMQIEAAREHTAALREQVAALSAQRDAAHAEVQRERDHGDQRVQDLHDTYARQISELRPSTAEPTRPRARTKKTTTPHN